MEMLSITPQQKAEIASRCHHSTFRPREHQDFYDGSGDLTRMKVKKIARTVNREVMTLEFECGCKERAVSLALTPTNCPGTLRCNYRHLELFPTLTKLD